MKTTFASFEEAYEYVKTLTIKEKLELVKEVYKRSYGADKAGVRSFINFYEKELNRQGHTNDE